MTATPATDGADQRADEPSSTPIADHLAGGARTKPLELVGRSSHGSHCVEAAACRTSRARPKVDDGAEHALDEALDHERHADEPVRGADELHHLDLAPAGEHGHADRVEDQQRRRRGAGPAATIEHADR